jgi:hypothetical protein
MSYAGTLGTAAIPTVLAALCLVWLTRRLGRETLFPAIVFGLCTPAWAYATLYWGHALASACLVFGFTAAVALRDSHRDVWLAAAVGLATGWATVTEYPAAPAGGIIAALALSQAPRRGRALFAMLGGALLCGGAFAAYNAAAFGEPFMLSYAHVQGFGGMRQGVFGVTSPKGHVLVELAVGRYRGLLPLSPVLAGAPVGFVMLWRGGHRAMVGGAAAIAVYYLLLNAAYVYWAGGWSYGRTTWLSDDLPSTYWRKSLRAPRVA